MTEENTAHGVFVSLPRPQQPLPPPTSGGKGRFESLGAMVKDAWKEDPNPPSHAWVRYSLSAGIPLVDFIEAFRELSTIKYAFGCRVFVHPVRMDHHEIELGDFDHMVNHETGRYEIEARWRKKRTDGGTHIVFAVESTAEESRRDHSTGLDALDALESLIRITLGAMTVVQTRHTQHEDLISGQIDGDSPKFHVYGPAELPRRDNASITAAIELAERSARLSVSNIGRLSLGMRWANIAFKQHDLLAFWTAIEILAECRGHKVYPVFAKAYGHAPRHGQTFARELGLDFIYKLRGDLAHDGLPINMNPLGASYLNALIHDLARYAAGLPCLQLAKIALGDHRVEEWLMREAIP